MTVAFDWLLEHRQILAERRHEHWEYMFEDGTWQVSCMCGYWYEHVQRKGLCYAAYTKHMEYQRFELAVVETALKSIEHMFIITTN